jgi:hypothetical protein
MAASHPRKKRIEIDVLFAPLPQALILDPHVSAQACRLWGVLYVFRWNDRQPDFAPLADALGTTERSVYRWLQELEATGWIAWNRNASVPDRFTLCTTAAPAQSDIGVNSPPQELIPLSNKLIPGSKQLTPRSEELTQVSISTCFDPLPAPQTEDRSSDQKDQKIQNGVGVGGRTLAFLIDQGVNAAEEFTDLPYESMRADYDARRADGQNNGSIVRAWRRNPPTKDYHYERSRSVADRAPAERTPAERPAVPANLKRVSSASWKKSNTSE